MKLPIRILRARAPFDFRRTLAFACGFTPMAGEQETEGGALTKALIVGGHPVVVRVAPAGDGSDPTALELAIESPRPLEVRAIDRIAERVSFVLSLDDDLATFVARARRDEALAPVARALHGMHHLKFPSALELTCWAVLAQRTPMGLARKHKRAIVERFGAAIESGGRTHRAFPDAARLAEVPERELARIVAHPRKAASLAEIARRFAAIDADAHLRDIPFAQAEAWLRDLPSIGAWSTAFVLFRGLGRMERATIEGPLLECARRVYGAGARVSELEEIAAGYGRDVGTWALYLRTGASDGIARAAHAMPDVAGSPRGEGRPWRGERQSG